MGAVAVALLLSGCAAQPTVESVQTASTPMTTTGPATAPAGDAALARFARVAEAVARRDHPGGMDFVRALERAGWARSALQVTADRTSVGLDVPAVQFAARDGASCLIGQYGRSGTTVLRAAPVDGTCLVGGTRRLP